VIPSVSSYLIYALRVSNLRFKLIALLLEASISFKSLSISALCSYSTSLGETNFWASWATLVNLLFHLSSTLSRFFAAVSHSLADLWISPFDWIGTLAFFSFYPLLLYLLEESLSPISLFKVLIKDSYLLISFSSSDELAYTFAL